MAGSAAVDTGEGAWMAPKKLTIAMQASEGAWYRLTRRAFAGQTKT